MNVLVIGGTGWVGHNIVRVLKKNAIPVTILSRGRKTAYSGEIPDVPTVCADKTDENAMKEILSARYTHIIDTLPQMEAIDIIRRHAPGLHHYIHCSSTGGYAPLPFIPCDETARYGGFNPTAGWYRKMLMDNAVMEAFRTEGFPATVIRPCYISGPGDLPLDNLGGRRADFLADVIHEKTLDLPDNGQALLQPIHVQDLATAFFNAMQNPSASLGQIYNICLDHAVTLNRYLEITAGVFGKKPRINYMSVDDILAKYGSAISENGLRFLAMHMCFTNAKARRDIHFRPAHTPEETIEETAVLGARQQGLV